MGIAYVGKFLYLCVMWIKQVKKKNSEKGKVFYQYQLTETYRIGDVVKHKSVLYLGDNELLRDKGSRQIFGKLLEGKIRKAMELSEEMETAPEELRKLAESYYEKYLLKMEGQQTAVANAPWPAAVEYDTVDSSSTQVFNCREIGAEWMCHDMLRRIGLGSYLQGKGWDEKETDLALVSIIGRAVACFSEHKTEKWLSDNSALTELFSSLPGTVSRHYLYKSSDRLYDIKESLEGFFYERLTSMFEMEDKIIIYDLTNTYFEGRMENSKIARYGRSKEKRYDCKQVVLAAVVNEHGFLRQSKIYEGNMSDPVTLSDIISQLQSTGQSTEGQVVVIDAGIASEDNLAMLREKGLKYVCVSRSKLKGFGPADIAGPMTIRDKKGSEIKVKSISKEGMPDSWVYVKSAGKTIKEESMQAKAFERFELEMESACKAIGKKGGTKKTEKVWERIGRIKERNKKAQQYYEIDVRSESGTAKEIKWSKKEHVKGKEAEGVYFLRTNCELENEALVWQVYNTVREVESTFRCLKTDLSLRPVYHQDDCHIESHLHLGLLAYQVVAPILYMLKEKGITMGWQNIVRTMNTQKAVSVKQTTKEGNEIIIRTCSRPNASALEIYQALGMGSMPFRSKKFVVHH